MILNLLALVAAQAADPVSATPATPAVAPATPCELDGIPPVDLVALRVAMLDQVKNGAARPASAEQTLDAIGAKAGACATGDEAARKAAASAAIGRFAAATMAEDLTASGVEVAKVDAVLRAAEPAVLDAFVAKRFDAPGVAELGEQVIAVAGSDATPETRKLLGAYAFNTARLARRGLTGPGR